MHELSAHIRKETIINGVTNAIFNGGIAWWLLYDKEPLSFWGMHSFGIDMIATATILLFIVALILIPLNRRKVSKGQLAPIRWDESRALHRILRRLPRKLFGRALFFGLAGLLIIAPLSLLILKVLGIQSIAATSYAVFKGFWAGAVAASMVGPMILVAAAEPPATAECRSVG